MEAEHHEPLQRDVVLRPGGLLRWVLRPRAGLVFVESRPPGLLLHVNGNPAQVTPTTLRLTPGRHRIRLVSPCYEEDVREVQVTAASAQQIGFDPSPLTRRLAFEARDPDGQGIRASIVLPEREARVIGATPGTFELPQCVRIVALRHPQWGESEVRIDAAMKRVVGVLDGTEHRLLRLGRYVLEGRGSSQPRVLVTLINDFNTKSTKHLGRLANHLATLPDVHVTVIHNPGFRQRYGREAATGALAASRQGRFWEMFKRLHRNPSTVSPDDIRAHGRSMNLDMPRFLADLASPTLKGELSWHRRVAWALSQRPAPAAYVNGRRRDFVRSLSSLSSLITLEREAVVRAGWSEVKARIRNQNPEFASYLLDGAEPPPEPIRPRRNFDTAVWKVPLHGEEPAQGGSDKTALVTLVVFKNYYTCRSCREFQTLIDRALTRFGDRLRVLHKQSPPPYYARNPMMAARVAECARRQGKFFAFDREIVNRGRVATGTVARAQQTVGMDRDALERCLNDADVERVLDEDAMAAIALTVGKRSAMFVNGRLVDDAPLWEDFERLIEEEMEKGRRRLAKGIKRYRLFATMVAKGRQQFVISKDRKRIRQRGAIRLGARNASVSMVVWLDFQSSSSRRLWSSLTKARSSLGRKTRLIIKVLPGRYNSNQLSGEALYCAQAQKGEEAFIAHMFTQRYYRPKRRVFVDWARKQGLDVPRFERCVDSKKMTLSVDADSAEARRFGIRSPPALFINGYALTSRAYAAHDPAVMRRYVRLALRQSKQRP